MATRNTHQKEVIARIVKASCDHPTAEMVLDKAKEEIPALSLGTVYRVLKDMVKTARLEKSFARTLRQDLTKPPSITGISLA